MDKDQHIEDLAVKLLAANTELHDLRAKIRGGGYAAPILAELVVLKNIHDDPDASPTLRAKYEREKPLAWNRARAWLAAWHPQMSKGGDGV